MKNKDVKVFLEKNNFVPSKKMGQNFLINENVQKSIVTASNINNDDCVLEIGPGLGAITKHLLATTKNVAAIELDKRLYDFLSKKYPNLKLVNDDILKFDVTAFLNQINFKNVKVVANLPYSISSKIILKLIKEPNIQQINILVQKEMAERLVAKVNTKDYNAFTVLVSMYANVSHKLRVSKNEFNPIPKVDSSFITIDKINKFNINYYEIDKFLRLSFVSKRKKLLNNLSSVYSKEIIRKCFDDLSLDENIRAENLTNEKFFQLFNKVKEYEREENN